jgi:hypothetical protein
MNNEGLQRLVKRIQDQSQEFKQDYANSLMDACDSLLELTAQAIVKHDVFGPEGMALDASHSVRIVRLLEAKRALKKWRMPAETAEEIKARQASLAVTPASAAPRPV